MFQNLVDVAYIGATILFILALSGLSKQETARRGNVFGIIGMVVALTATTIGVINENYVLLMVVLVIGSSIGLLLAKKVRMTQMPELVAILHSFVGLAAVLVGFSTFLSHKINLYGIEKTIHNLEAYIGIFIGAMTFSGSIVAYLKLSGKWGGKPLLLPARHFLNLGLMVLAIYLGVEFIIQASVNSDFSINSGLFPLLSMTIVALLFGAHMVAAIGGADMPVVVSMLNSYSGWAAAALGFMLSNDLLIVIGALVGSSGAILSYIMCRAMNRNFLSVIAGGFGKTLTNSSSTINETESELVVTSVEEVANILNSAKEIIIIPGYGMAVAQAQHVVSNISDSLRRKGINVRFAIHPVAGRMPGHMNVLLAEAKVPYDIVFEIEEINEDFPNVDVSIVIGANDIVNPAAKEVPDSPISGMPVLEPWLGGTTIVLKRGMATGYAGIENPLFYRENTRMLFGDAKESLEGLFKSITLFS